MRFVRTRQLAVIRGGAAAVELRRHTENTKTCHDERRKLWRNTTRPGLCGGATVVICGMKAVQCYFLRVQKLWYTLTASSRAELAASKCSDCWKGDCRKLSQLDKPHKCTAQPAKAGSPRSWSPESLCLLRYSAKREVFNGNPASVVDLAVATLSSKAPEPGHRQAEPTW